MLNFGARGCRNGCNNCRGFFTGLRATIKAYLLTCAFLRFLVPRDIIIKDNTSLPRPEPLGFAWGSSHAIVDNDWKLLNTPGAGQCDFQEPYKSMKRLDDYYLFNLASVKSGTHLPTKNHLSMQY